MADRQHCRAKRAWVPDGKVVNFGALVRRGRTDQTCRRWFTIGILRGTVMHHPQLAYLLVSIASYWRVARLLDDLDLVNGSRLGVR